MKILYMGKVVNILTSSFLATIIALTILLFTSCEEENTSSSSDLVVLEGYLYQGEAVDSIHITKALSFESEDTIYPSVSDAEVFIIWNNTEYKLESIGNGYYNYTGDNLSIKQGESYSILVKYNGVNVTSSTTVPLIPVGITLSDSVVTIDTTARFGPPGENSDTSGIKVSWNDSTSYYYVLLESTDSTAADIVMGGGFGPGGGFRPEGAPSMKMFRFRSEPFKGNSYTINSRSLEKYGKYKIRIYRVNQEYVDLYRNRQQDSRNLTEPITNITNGLGVFTSFSFTEATFNVVKLE